MKHLLLSMFALAFALSVTAQSGVEYTKKDIMNLTYDQLVEMPFDQVMRLAEIMGVTSDDLFKMIMNKSLSSASKSEEDAFASPLSSTVITRDEMRTYGCTTIEEALRLIPGVVVQQKGNGSFDIYIRGLNNIPDNQMLVYTENSNVLMMLDGRVTHNYAMGAANIEHMPISIEDIERIEVVRGASSALYGPNAVQGVINIITQKAESENLTVSGSVQAGNLKTAIADVAVRKRINNKIATGFTMNAQYRNRPIDKVWSYGAGSYDNEFGLPDENGEYVKYVDENGDGVPDNVVLSNPITQAGWMSIDQMKQTKIINSFTGELVDMIYFEDQLENRFCNDAKLARKNFGFNGYLTINPSLNSRIDITSGYGQQFILTQTPTDVDFAHAYRIFKNGYVNVDAHLGNLTVNASYMAGPQNYYKGLPEYKVNLRTASASADYNWQIGERLKIRPGVYWHWIEYEDSKIEEGFVGFLNERTAMRDFAPSLRVDYSLDKFRFIAAIRSDKTNMPDKWNTSWQFAANYNLNNVNFFRFVYSRAMRGAVGLNASCSYAWDRNTYPNRISFLGNPDADLMHIDNFEFGYRLRPNDKLLFDFEAFYSNSTNYGALMSDHSELTVSTDKLIGAMSSGSGLDMGNFANLINIESYMKYRNIDYNVHQMGASMSMDWIVSPKLVSRVNLNVQKTIIDNYFTYKQSDEISSQIMGGDGSCMTKAMMLLSGLPSDGGLVGMLGYVNSEVEKGNAFIKGDYEAIGVSSSAYDTPETKDGFKSKATPSIYGSLSLIYKPISKISISTMLNFIGERTYVTKYSTEVMNPRFTIDLKAGYKATDKIEVFANARNLLNNKKREFPYMDEIGGLYTAGVLFNF